jgi:death-on-curing protein
MKTLSLEQLLQLHVLVVDSTGGAHGIKDLGRLEAVIAVQTQEVFGETLYETLQEKAAAIIRGIVGDHPFIDGNKRTAMLSATTFLEINGLGFIAEPKELEDFAVKVAVDNLGIPEITRWLKYHTKPNSV